MWPGGLIDLHHHVIPPALLEELSGSVGTGGTSGLRLPSWSKDGMLSFMDDNMIGTVIASVAFNISSGDAAPTVKMARQCNDFLAELVRDRPDRCGGFGVLPLPFVDESIAEIDRIFDDLGLDGVMLSTNYAGAYLGDPVFDAVFDALERRGALAFVHPTESPDAVAHSLGIPDFVFDYVADTTRAIARLHYSNTFARTPSVRYVFSHAGGTVPFIAQRFDLLDSTNAVPGSEIRGPARDQFRRLYFDTALAYQKPVLSLAADVVGSTQLVFGSDRPYALDRSEEAATAINSADYLSIEARAAIGWQNAQRLLPRLAS
ncbi:amidohydrolase family protein [Leifsonia sp. A12D58]|uniref:amidohydrolase family protein n=1 Tax=Leifsonia sp. A12D58 TaxID=3397674 RepID=UPI0039DFB3A2